MIVMSVSRPSVLARSSISAAAFYACARCDTFNFWSRRCYGLVLVLRSPPPPPDTSASEGTRTKNRGQSTNFFSSPCLPATANGFNEDPGFDLFSAYKEGADSVWLLGTDSSTAIDFFIEVR